MKLNLVLILDKLPERILYNDDWYYWVGLDKCDGLYRTSYDKVMSSEQVSIFNCKHHNPETAAYMLYEKLVKEKLI